MVTELSCLVTTSHQLEALLNIILQDIRDHIDSFARSLTVRQTHSLSYWMWKCLCVDWIYEHLDLHPTNDVFLLKDNIKNRNSWPFELGERNMFYLSILSCRQKSFGIKDKDIPFILFFFNNSGGHLISKPIFLLKYPRY